MVPLCQPRRITPPPWLNNSRTFLRVLGTRLRPDTQLIPAPDMSANALLRRLLLPQTRGRCAAWLLHFCSS